MVNITFIWYPKCSTSKKAKKWLDENAISYEERNIVIDNPSVAEIAAWHAASGLPIRRLFNTSGKLYREMNVKAILDGGLPDAKAYELLASDGMMIKRPVVVGNGFTLFGFRQDEWEEKLLKR